MSTEDRGLSEMPKPGGSMTPQWWKEVYGEKMCVTSLDFKGNETHKKQLLNALNEDSDNSKDYINTTLEISNYVILPASTTNEQGEVIDFIRCVLILKDGGRVAFGSTGVVKSLMLITTLDREAPWEPPIRKRLVSRSLRNGKQMYALVDPPKEPQAAAKDKAAK